MKYQTIENAGIVWLGTIYRTLLSARDTGGVQSIVEIVSPPHSGPPRHIHDAEDETFIILSGTFRFWVNGETFVRKAGETAFIPRGADHAFRVISDMPARHLIVLTPGGFEDFFVEMATGRYSIPENMPEVEASAVRHSLRFTGPPLEA